MCIRDRVNTSFLGITDDFFAEDNKFPAFFFATSQVYDKLFEILDCNETSGVRIINLPYLLKIVECIWLYRKLEMICLMNECVYDNRDEQVQEDLTDQYMEESEEKVAGHG